MGEMTAMAVSACDVDHELEMLRKKNESLSKKVLDVYLAVVTVKEVVLPACCLFWCLSSCLCQTKSYTLQNSTS